MSSKFFFASMARDRPSPYGGRRILAWRGIGVGETSWSRCTPFTVARGPVPRELSTETKTVRSPEATDGFCDNPGTARDRPSPYGARRDFLRFTVARGPVPREASCCLNQDSQESHDLQEYLPRNEHSFFNGCLFRSVGPACL